MPFSLESQPLTRMHATIPLTALFHAPLLSGIDVTKVRYSVLLRNGQPLLLIPPSRQTAAITLDLYLPQGRKARLAVAGLKLANALGLLPALLPRLDMNPAGDRPASGLMPFVQHEIDQSCVGFLLCNPDHGCARVIAVRHADRPDVIKWTAIAGEASLAAEIASIHELTARHLPGIPEIIAQGRTATSYWVVFPLYANPAIKTITDPRVLRLLQGWLSEETVPPLDNTFIASLWTPHDRSASQNEVDRLRRLRIRRAVVHGDFAVWNLRARQDGLVAIDWEWAEPDGIAGIDLCHGLIQEALLVRKLSAPRVLDFVRSAADAPHCKAYLHSTGWLEAPDLWLKTAILYRHTRKPCPELLATLATHPAR